MNLWYCIFGGLKPMAYVFWEGIWRKTCRKSPTTNFGSFWKTAKVTWTKTKLPKNPFALPFTSSECSHTQMTLKFSLAHVLLPYFHLGEGAFILFYSLFCSFLLCYFFPSIYNALLFFCFCFWCFIKTYITVTDFENSLLPINLGGKWTFDVGRRQRRLI